MIVQRRLQTYDRAAIKSVITDGLAPFGGLDTVFANRNRILLKPNFVVPERPDKWATTHPDVYMALAELLQASGRSVAIGDSPAFGSAATAVKQHRVWDEIQERGIDVITFKQPTPCTGVSGDTCYSSLTIARELNDFDGIVNVPKLKVHQQFMVTGATKNLYGCVTGKRKVFRHNICRNDPVRFAHMIIANAKAANPILNIADGITAMHVRGPRGGHPYPLNTMLFSDCYLELDWLFCCLIGLNPETTPLFRAIGPEQKQQLATACSDLVTAPDFLPAHDFRLSYAVDISFSPPHVVRSLWRTARFRLGELIGSPHLISR